MTSSLPHSGDHEQFINSLAIDRLRVHSALISIFAVRNGERRVIKRRLFPADSFISERFQECDKIRYVRTAQVERLNRRGQVGGIRTVSARVSGQRSSSVTASVVELDDLL